MVLALGRNGPVLWSDCQDHGLRPGPGPKHRPDGLSADGADTGGTLPRLRAADGGELPPHLYGKAGPCFAIWLDLRGRSGPRTWRRTRHTPGLNRALARYLPGNPTLMPRPD